MASNKLQKKQVEAFWAQVVLTASIGGFFVVRITVREQPRRSSVETFLELTPVLPDQVSSLASDEEMRQSLRPQCYCTIMDRRARFMRNGFKDLPCDGTLCADKRAAAEQETDSVRV